MATTVTASTLTVTLTESITLAGEDRGATNEYTIASVSNVSKSIVTCLNANEVPLLGFTSAAGTQPTSSTISYLGGYFDEDDVRYVRITNLDDTNYVLLTLRTSANTNAGEIAIKLDKGASFIYGVDLDAGIEATVTQSQSALSATHDLALGDLHDIAGIANTADVELEIFVASV